MISLRHGIESGSVFRTAPQQNRPNSGRFVLAGHYRRPARNILRSKICKMSASGGCDRDEYIDIPQAVKALQTRRFCEPLDTDNSLRNLSDFQRVIWCPGEDSNLHAREDTST